MPQKINVKKKEKKYVEQQPIKNNNQRHLGIIWIKRGFSIMMLWELWQYLGL